MSARTTHRLSHLLALVVVLLASAVAQAQYEHYAYLRDDGPGAFGTILTSLTLAALLVLSWYVTTFLHELGHAIAGLLVGVRHVTIYLGLHDDDPGSVSVRTPLIGFLVHRNPLRWSFGYAVNAKQPSFVGYVVFVLGGPLLPLIVGPTAVVLGLHGQVHWALQWLAIFVLLIALIDVPMNLLPRHAWLGEGRGWRHLGWYFNDGHLLVQHLRWRRHYPTIVRGHELYSEGRYAEAAELLAPLGDLIVNHDLYRMAMWSCRAASDHERALHLCRTAYEHVTFDADDYAVASAIEGECGNYEEGAEAAEAALRLDPEHLFARCNLGFTMLCLERYDEALEAFDAVLAREPESAYAHANRGCALLRIGRADEARAAIEEALRIDANEPYALRSLGLLLLSEGRVEEGNASLRRALELHPNTHDTERHLVGIPQEF